MVLLLAVACMTAFDPVVAPHTTGAPSLAAPPGSCDHQTSLHVVPPAPSQDRWLATPRPVGVGVALPDGAAPNLDALGGLFWQGAGDEVPYQARATAHWPDGSVQWAYLEIVDRPPASGHYTLDYGPFCSRLAPPPVSPMAVYDGDRLRIETASGPATGLTAVIDPATPDLAVVTTTLEASRVEAVLGLVKHGETWAEDAALAASVVWDPPSLVRETWQRAVIRLTGRTSVLDHPDMAHLDLRLTFTRGTATVDVEHALTWLQFGSCAPGGGDGDCGVQGPTDPVPGAEQQTHPLWLKELGLDIVSASPHSRMGIGACTDAGCSDFRLGIGPGMSVSQVGPNLVALSSGPTVAAQLAGFATAHSADGTPLASVAVKDAWQRFPTALAAGPDRLGARFWPKTAKPWSFATWDADRRAGEVTTPLPTELQGEDCGTCSCTAMDNTPCLPAEPDRDGADLWTLYKGYFGQAHDKRTPTPSTNDGTVRAHGTTLTHFAQLRFARAGASPGAFYTDARAQASFLQHPTVLVQDAADSLAVPTGSVFAAPWNGAPHGEPFEHALDAIYDFALGRSACLHDYGAWTYGAVRYAHPATRLDRWLEGVQYGAALLPWMQHRRRARDEGGLDDRGFYEDGVATALHAMDTSFNRSDFDPSYTGYHGFTGEASSHPFIAIPRHLSGNRTVIGNMHLRVDFLLEHHRLTGHERAGELLDEVASELVRAFGACEGGCDAGAARGLYVPTLALAALIAHTEHRLPDVTTGLVDLREGWLARIAALDDPGTEDDDQATSASCVPGSCSDDFGVFRAPRVGLYEAMAAHSAVDALPLELTQLLEEDALQGGIDLPTATLPAGGLHDPRQLQLARWYAARAPGLAQSLVEVSRSLADAVPELDLSDAPGVCDSTPYGTESHPPADARKWALALWSGHALLDEVDASIDTTDDTYLAVNGCSDAFVRPDDPEAPVTLEVALQGGDGLTWYDETDAVPSMDDHRMTVEVLALDPSGGVTVVASTLLQPTCCTDPTSAEFTPRRLAGSHDTLVVDRVALGLPTDSDLTVVGHPEVRCGEDLWCPLDTLDLFFGVRSPNAAVVHRMPAGGHHPYVPYVDTGVSSIRLMSGTLGDPTGARATIRHDGGGVPSALCLSTNGEPEGLTLRDADAPLADPPLYRTNFSDTRGIPRTLDTRLTHGIPLSASAIQARVSGRGRRFALKNTCSECDGDGVCFDRSQWVSVAPASWFEPGPAPLLDPGDDCRSCGAHFDLCP
jgi:hypothetical protein